MGTVDFVVVAVYAALMVAIALVAKRKSRGADEYFAAGHRLPWWMAAISHHVSGYSAVVFTGFAGQAAKAGLSAWTLFSLACFLAMMIGLPIWAPRWPRLKVLTAVEYLETRYGNATRLLTAILGILLKLLDLGIKIFAISVVVHVCTKWPILHICVASSLLTILYVLIGGLWATVLTDLVQFVVQLGLSGLVLVLVLSRVGGWSAMWEALPDDRARLFNPGQGIGFWFWAICFFVTVLSYNGGTWGLAQRFISVEKARDARKVAILSGFLYLLYPLLIFIPCWAAPLILTEQFDAATLLPTEAFKEQIEHTYVLLAQHLLDGLAPGLLGLLVCSMFAATMSMIDSDINSLAAVFSKDIYQRNFNPRATDRRLKMVGMLATIAIGCAVLAVGIVVAQSEGAEKVFETTVKLFGALLPPVFIPLMFGMIWRWTSQSGAILAMVGGFVTFAILRYHTDNYVVFAGVEILVTLIIYFGEGLICRKLFDEPREVTSLFAKLAGRDDR